MFLLTFYFFIYSHHLISSFCLSPSLSHSPHLSVLSNRPSVRRVSVEGKDPYVKSSSHTEGREAHDLWVPSASSGLWRHQSRILPQTEQDDEEGKILCKLWLVTTSQNYNLFGTSHHRILTLLPWLQRDVAFWCFVVFLLFYVFGLCFSSYVCSKCFLPQFLFFSLPTEHYCPLPVCVSVLYINVFISAFVGMCICAVFVNTCYLWPSNAQM